MGAETRYLEWDSHLFGYPVAKVLFKDTSSLNLDLVFQNLKDGRYRLTYLFVPQDEINISEYLLNIGCKLVDQKVLFSKVPVFHIFEKSHISEYDTLDHIDSMLELVYQAGTYSRFKLDNNFVNNEFEKLYKVWLSESIQKKIAFKTFITRYNNEITGFATLGEKNGFADIGLIAVANGFRNQGIGTSLVYSLENEAHISGFNEITVATQLINLEACKLYKRCGFHIKSITNVFHFWQK
jgi:dTDP-4-amino-4,6-dideoxy-D-galactose acyltransferase